MDTQLLLLAPGLVKEAMLAKSLKYLSKLSPAKKGLVAGGIGGVSGLGINSFLDSSLQNENSFLNSGVGKAVTNPLSTVMEKTTGKPMGDMQRTMMGMFSPIGPLGGMLEMKRQALNKERLLHLPGQPKGNGLVDPARAKQLRDTYLGPAGVRY